jgi:4-amino-4-deoxy-L-arabinose transferase-like glycosyltransferase
MQVTVALNPHRFGEDSAYYVGQARSIVADRGLVTRPRSGLEPDAWHPLAVFPPGYSLLIAAVMETTGAQATTAACAVSMLAGGLSLVMVVWIGSFFLPPLLLAAASCAIALMPCSATLSASPMSDAAYLFFALAALACAFRSCERREMRLGWMLASGALAGLAWATRYAGTALLLASLAFVALQIRWNPLRRVCGIAGAWALGLASTAAPLAVRNVAVFGRVIPYDQSPAPLSLPQALGEALGRVVADLSTVREPPAWLAQRTQDSIAFGFDIRYLLIALGVLVLAAGMVCFRALRRLPPAQLSETLLRQRPALLLGIYLCVYAAQVVAARAIYTWGEPIGERHFLQVYFIVWIFLALGMDRILRLRIASHRTRRVAGCLALSLLALLQLRSHHARLVEERPRFERARDLVAMAETHVLPRLRGGQFVLACGGVYMRFFFDTDVRRLPDVQDATPLGEPAIRQALAAGSLGVVLLDQLESARAGRFGPAIAGLIEGRALGDVLSQVPSPLPDVAIYVPARARTRRT